MFSTPLAFPGVTSAMRANEGHKAGYGAEQGSTPAFPEGNALAERSRQLAQRHRESIQKVQGVQCRHSMMVGWTY